MTESSAARGNITVQSYAALKERSKLEPYEFTARAVGDLDVQIKITHCAICASDLHQVNNGWGGALYPLVPGHEIIGHVTIVGSKVTDFKVGDRVGVSTVVLSCFSCSNCKRDEEQYCAKAVPTYSAKYPDGSLAYGGFASHITAHSHFVFHIPHQLSSAGAAPLLCAGITTYRPFREHADKVKPGAKIGIVGLGGLGHMGVQWGKAFGCHVTVISHSRDKEEMARKLGADAFICSEDEKQMGANKNTLSFLLITANAKGMKYGPLLDLLDFRGAACNVALPEAPLEIPGKALIFGSRSLSGSLTGGAKMIREMLAFAAEHRIEAKVEVRRMRDINKAFEDMAAHKPRFRYVLEADFETMYS